MQERPIAKYPIDHTIKYVAIIPIQILTIPLTDTFLFFRLLNAYLFL